MVLRGVKVSNQKFTMNSRVERFSKAADEGLAYGCL
jgi:hypothetical protein